MSETPSTPPKAVTWPMVAYAFVRQLPHIISVVAGSVVAIVLVLKVPSSLEAALIPAVVPIVVSALAQSRPADSAVLTGSASLLWLLIRAKFFGG